MKQELKIDNDKVKDSSVETAYRIGQPRQENSVTRNIFANSPIIWTMSMLENKVNV